VSICWMSYPSCQPFSSDTCPLSLSISKNHWKISFYLPNYQTTKIANNYHKTTILNHSFIFISNTTLSNIVLSTTICLFSDHTSIVPSNHPFSPPFSIPSPNALDSTVLTTQIPISKLYSVIIDFILYSFLILSLFSISHCQYYLPYLCAVC